MSDSELAYLSATELVRAYRAGTVSPVDVIDVVLARIEALNPVLNAFCLVDAEGAREAARASAQRWRRGEPAGPVDGVPASIKDLVLTRGWPTLRGSRTVDPAGPWTVDAPATARLREAGAVLLGKTTTPEFGWRGSTDSPLTGITRNPWNTGTTPGGSSGGACSAVAAGLGALAVGTDGGGSVRIPAAFTGTVGLKPHFGRVPAYPLSPMGNVAHIGTQTRTVDDAALMLSVLARPDRRDWLSLPPAADGWLDGLEDTLRGLRIGYSPRLGYVDYVDPRVAASVDAAARTFESLGAIVEAADPGITDSQEVFRVHWFSSARQFLTKLPPDKFALLDPGLRAVVEDAARYTLSDFLDAQAARAPLAVAMAEYHRKYDLMLTPATAIPAFPVGLVAPPQPSQVDCAVNDWTWWTPFSFPFNLTQQPAIVLPCGFTDDGLPIALQLVGPNHREDLCLRAARAYERGTDWHRRRPPLDR